jgi:aminopeptidase YwaD
MFQAALDLIRTECSGQAALNFVGDISRCHRIQASPGFRQAAHYVLDTLTAWGVQAELLTFAANHATSYWGERMFQEWQTKLGTLHLIEPAGEACKLADYRDVPLSLLPRSSRFEGECELVVLNTGEERGDYTGLDVSGKIVLTSGNVMRVYSLAVETFGAAGILFDGMRSLEPVCPPMALPDAIQYTSFWWSSEDKPCFGFALSPRRGQWLRQLVRQQAAEGKAVRVRARVDAELYDGSIEDVVALIPGSGEQEVVVVSHLCHPAPCANDNASGAAAAMEAAHALYHLIESGALPRPPRSIWAESSPVLTWTWWAKIRPRPAA